LKCLDLWKEHWISLRLASKPLPVVWRVARSLPTRPLLAPGGAGRDGGLQGIATPKSAFQVGWKSRCKPLKSLKTAMEIARFGTEGARVAKFPENGP
jgi:hypothetical protein